ncbi:hypothetical protein FFF34_002570 [Inquilinus sp. KBS0705]|nr:hypothetical protein FFF34_002570 [Inquilinus sp. KBS0705]
MADLTSIYRNKRFRDIAIQACVNGILAATELYPIFFSQGKLTDFIDIQGGTQPPKSQFVFGEKEGYERFLQIRDFSSESTVTYIPKDKKNKTCNSNDVLLGRYGASVGKVLTGKAGAYNVACAKVIILDEDILDQNFLFYFLHASIIQDTIKNISRSAQGGFNKGDLDRIKISIPHKEWQLKLCKILESIDHILLNELEYNFEETDSDFINYLNSMFQKSLEINNEVQELLIQCKNQQDQIKSLKEAILQDGVEGNLHTQVLVNETGEQLLARIKKSNIDRPSKGKKSQNGPISDFEEPFKLPKSWAWCNLSEIADVVSGITLGKTYRGELIKTPYLRVANVQRRYIDISDVKELEVTAKEIDKYRLHYGDLLMIEGGDWDKVGRCAIWNEKLSPIIHQNHIYCIRSRGGILNAYLEIYLNSPITRRYFESCSKQTTNLASINKTQLLNTLIALPSLDEQQLIVNSVNEIISLCDDLESNTNMSVDNIEILIQSVIKQSFKENNKIDNAAIAIKTFTSEENILLLASEIIWQLNRKPTFGHIKLQKLIFLCERIRKMNLPVNFLRQAMGPYDPKLQRYLDVELEKKAWFKYDETQTLKYQPLVNAGSHKLAFKAQFGDQVESIYHLIQLFENTNSASIEIVATLFACWEEMILKNQLVNDTALLSKFYDWSEFKRNYSAEQVKSALRWMESNGIVPQQLAIQN